MRVLFGLSGHRDYSLFENLFKAFGIEKCVVYSTIKKFSRMVRRLRATSASLYVI